MIMAKTCSTIGCLEIATHELTWRDRTDGAIVTDPVCGGCGEGYLRRPSLRATLRRLFEIGPRVVHVENERNRIWDRRINGTLYRFVNTPERVFVLRAPGDPFMDKVHEWRSISGGE
ncbi:hypothetical protein [Streptomyces johnsoniae]|uniref:Uncharacterized protein n=1 Tax=Streptomyces johnsoniae TaxID=3075532 RepID=A0ABU2S027_9ACTN|nr:hypothetical protein [Streptomyces sp. DSM 41886]MDT0442300.1 hypothetical protein [Streptomyces sp. DSM 41886]